MWRSDVLERKSLVGSIPTPGKQEESMGEYIDLCGEVVDFMGSVVVTLLGAAVLGPLVLTMVVIASPIALPIFIYRKIKEKTIFSTNFSETS